MNIDKAMLEKELISLRQQEQEHLSALSAVSGAMQFCQELIERASEPEPVKESGPQLVPDKTESPAQTG